MRAPSVVLLALLPWTAGCTWFKGNAEVLITSDPAGARIFIDGHDSGETTPHAFEMAGNFGSDHVVELRRKGYRPEVRYLTQYTIGYTFRWIDGAGDVGLPPLPIFLTPGDFVFPFGVQGAIVPGEVFVKLYREDEPLLGFEAVAARVTAPPRDDAEPATAPDAGR